jgi:hypothetical protein
LGVVAGWRDDEAALEWLGALEQDPSEKTVVKALEAAPGNGEVAVVAAELVAYSLGRTPEAPEAQLLTLSALLPDLDRHRALAARAVTAAGGDVGLQARLAPPA